MFFSAATESGSTGAPNEDWVGVSPTAAVVLDGVTVPGDAEGGCRHGTPWYVSQLGTRLVAAAMNPAMSLTAALANAIQVVADAHADVCDLTQIDAPSAAVAAVRVQEQMVDYLVLADATILLDTSAKLHVITDDRVASTVHDLEGQEDIGMQVMERRARYRNQEGGYWVAAADPKAASHAVAGNVPLAGLTYAALMTDGITRLVAPFEQTTWRGLLELGITSDADSVLRYVRRAEADDPHGNRWPRFKISDDATIVIIGFNQH